MHEIGVARQIVRTVTDFAQENGVTNIREVVVDCGELSLIIPEYLKSIEIYLRAIENLLKI